MSVIKSPFSVTKTQGRHKVLKEKSSDEITLSTDQRKYMMMEVCHSSTKAESCDNENTAIVTNQQVLNLWKEDEQLCCHPIHNWDVPRKSEKERTNEKRKWKTVDNCSENRTWPDVKLLLFFFFISFLLKKKHPIFGVHILCIPIL